MTTKMNAKNPKLELHRVYAGGKPAIMLVVLNAYYVPALAAICDDLGIMPTVDIANSRSITVTSAAELDAVRDPLRIWFDARGEFRLPRLVEAD